MCCNDKQEKLCITDVPIFSSIESEDINIIANSIISRKYTKGDYIFREGDSSAGLYVIHTGMVKLSKLSDSGKEQIMRLLLPGDFWGHYTLLNNKNHYANAEVVADCSICFIPSESFVSYLKNNTHVALNFIDALSQLIFQADDLVGTISLMDVESRIAKVILYYANINKSNKDVIPFSRKDFASLIGTSSETLSRKITNLQTKKLIKLNGRKEIDILNKEKLQVIANKF